MKKIKKNITKLSFFTAILLSPLTTIHADTVYENASDGNTNGWHIYDKWPSGAKIENISDPQRGKVIKVTGTISNGVHLLGWKDRNSVLQWKMKADKWNSFYITIQTSKGFRYLSYSPRSIDKGIDSKKKYKIRYGIGPKMQDGKWHTFTRDLKADLKKFEPDNKYLYVQGIKFRGAASFDDIKTIDSKANKKTIILNDLKAFPTAEGAGAKTTGGRDGKVVYVTNRKASEKGSLKAALTQKGKRTIVFAIGGRFNIDKGITLGSKKPNKKNIYPKDRLYSNFTLAGQTANNIGGVHLAHSDKRDNDATTVFGSGKGASHFNIYNQENMILRYFDSRYNWNWFLKRGLDGKEPTIRFTHVKDLIIDHVTSGWSSYGFIILNKTEVVKRKNVPTLGNITIQRSLMHENIVNPNASQLPKKVRQSNHNVALLLGKDPKGRKNLFMSEAEWNDMGEFTIHKNAFIGVSHRFPNSSGGENGKFRMINNFVYGFNGDGTGERLGRFAGTSRNDLISNVYQLRPYLNLKHDTMDFNSKNLYAYLTKESPNSIVTKANFYVEDNLFLKSNGTKHSITNEIKENSYLMLFDYTSSNPNSSSRKHLSSANANLASKPIQASYPMSIFKSNTVKSKVLANVGGNVRFKKNGLPYINDEIDKKYINWAKTNTKLTEKTTSIGDGGMGDSARFKYPTKNWTKAWHYKEDIEEEINPKILDFDLDGMPTAWEKQHELNHEIANNNARTLHWDFGDYKVINNAGYTDLEMYLADMAGDFHMLANK